MEVKVRAREAPARLGILAGGRTRARRRWPWLAGAAGLIVAGALSFAFYAWPTGALAVAATGLPRVRPPLFGARLVGVSLQDEHGRAIPVRMLTTGTLWPTRRVIAPGTRLVATVVFRRPGWVGWIAGRTQTVRLDLTAPRASLTARWLRVRPGAAVSVRFDRPVRQVEVTGRGAPRLVRLHRPLRVVALGRLGDAGSLGVSGVARTWERLPAATSVTWFPPGPAPKVLVSPAPGTPLDPSSQIRLRFSEPVAGLLHGRVPSLRPAVPGSWRTLDTHTLAFSPTGYGFGLDMPVRIRLPVRVEPAGAGRPTTTLAWQTPAGTELRLQQLLALLGYLPLRWTPARADPPTTPAIEETAAVRPPAGRFAWRYRSTPASLRTLWQPGRDNVIVRGAIMAFEEAHHLPTDGAADRSVWRALIADEVAGRRHAGGYSYVFVHLTIPQSLNLWHNGRTILTSPGNTGVPAAPTQLGTYPVFEHIPIGTMSGTNPDGTHYYDPGIQYISYFNHGDAIHAFNRSSYGTPQSLGCVELPLAAAAEVWPYTPIGTLVTIEQ